MICADDRMNSDSKLLRWLKVIVLGCSLGLILVTVNFLLWSFLLGTDSARHVRSGPPLRLSAEPVKQELTRVIGSQLSDFRRGDFAGAYAFADSLLQAQVTPAMFEHMVKTGYPAMVECRSTSFGLCLDNGAEALMIVGIMNRSGRILQYRYILRHERSGWRISGVVRVRAEGHTV